MKASISATALAIALFIGHSTQSEATVLDYKMIGTVKSAIDPSSPFLGDEAVFHILLDTNQTGEPGGPSEGTYFQIIGATEHVGNFNWSTAGGTTFRHGEIQVIHGPLFDYTEIDLRAQPDPNNPVNPPGPLTGFFSIAFKSPLGTLSDESLPALQTFASQPWNNSFTFGAGQNSFSGAIQQISVTTVTATTPIPGALPLFVSALTGLGIVSWRRKRAYVAGPVVGATGSA